MVRVLIDDGVRSAALGSAVTFAVGVLGYFVEPVTESRYVDGFAVESGVGLTLDVLVYFGGRPLAHHVVMLVGGPAASTSLAVTASHLRGSTGPRVDWTVVAGVVGGPVVLVWLATAVSVAVIAGTDGAAYVPYALVFGIPASILLSAVVLVSALVGSLSGLLLARGLSRRLCRT